MSVAEKDLVNGFVNVCKDFAFGFRKDSLLAIELDNHTQNCIFTFFLFILYLYLFHILKDSHHTFPVISVLLTEIA